MAKRTFERAPIIVASIQRLLDSMKDGHGNMPVYTYAIPSAVVYKMDAFESELLDAFAKLQSLADLHKAGLIENKG